MPRFQMFQELKARFLIASGAEGFPAAPKRRGGGSRQRAWWEILGILGVTFGVCGVALYVLLTRPHDDALNKWATGVIGFVIGYYLK